MNSGRPGDGPLFGPGSAFTPTVLMPRIRALEAARLDTVLAGIEARGLETGWDNPPLRAALEGIAPEDRAPLLLSPDFRRWIARLVHALDPRAPADAALPVRVQSVWNQLAVPWLRSPASDRGSLWLLVFGDGRLQFPGCGLALEVAAGSRRVRLVASGEELRFEAENGVQLALADRHLLLAAAAGGASPPPGFTACPRLAGTGIEVVEDRGGSPRSAPDPLPVLELAMDRLAAAWPAGHALVSGLARRVQLDPSPDLNSKTVSELPGLIILGRHETGANSIAELLVHEAAHLLTYEAARLAPLLPGPGEPRHSPFSRARTRPAYMVLHGATSFLAQAIATARLGGEPALAGAAVRRELTRLEAAERELRAHLETHGAAPGPFVAAMFGEIEQLRRAIQAARAEPQ